MEVSDLRKLVGDGRFFGVSFVKRGDGTLRHMNCRVGVKAGTTGAGAAYDAESKGLLTVFDVQKKGYRMIPVENIREIRTKGRRLTPELALGRP